MTSIHQKIISTARTAALSLIAMGFTLACGQGVYGQQAEEAQTKSQKETQTSGTITAADINHTLRQAVAQVRPAVVYLKVYWTEQQPDNDNQVSQEQVRSGSGCIIDKRGYLLTNYHVVVGAEQVDVYLGQGQRYEAVEIMSDPDTDLAVVRIDPRGQALHAASFGDSDQSEVGDMVLAIGNPYGQLLSHTVTSGIISYKGRQPHVLGDWGYEDFIQTDAMINTGNSGGPLVNLYGQVIGVITNIYSPTEQSIGYAFAVSSNLARFVAEQLIENGRVRRSYLGIALRYETLEQVRQLSPEELADEGQGLAQLSLQLPKDLEGAMVDYVIQPGPAWRAGLADLDVITRLDGKPIRGASELRNQIAQLKPGKEILVSIWRFGYEQVLKVMLQDQEQVRLNGMPEESSGLSPRPPKTENQPEYSAFLKEQFGIEVAEITEELALQYGHPLRMYGLIVTGVSAQSGGPSLQEGDVVLKVNGTKVINLAQLEQLLGRSNLPRGGWELLIQNIQGIQRIYLPSTAVQAPENEQEMPGQEENSMELPQGQDTEDVE